MSFFCSLMKQLPLSFFINLLTYKKPIFLSLLKMCWHRKTAEWKGREREREREKEYYNISIRIGTKGFSSILQLSNLFSLKMKKFILRMPTWICRIGWRWARACSCARPTTRAPSPSSGPPSSRLESGSGLLLMLL